MGNPVINTWCSHPWTLNHSSMQNLSGSLISLGFHIWTALLNSDHMFLIAFKTGDRWSLQKH
uniref:Uncharacterized protein n=1 Tax=Anguilla anguilla TaxID=7936 RepID=A0A0E9PEL1_ANGAN